jgi:flagellar hook protein FlgE
MVKSMFAGVAGLKAHQSKMDVIGNNIANVNTWGYKSANMSFKDAMYQSTSSGSSGDTKNGGYGAVNANQVGYGVTTGSIAYDFGTGGMSPSSNGLDCMIDGTGFFLVGPMLNDGNISLDTEDAVKNSGLYLSRVGKFKVDPNGYLVDDGGNYVYGFQNTQYTGDPNLAKGALSPLKLPTKADMEAVTKGKSSTALANAKTALDKAQAAVNTAILAAGTARQEYFEAKALYDAAYKANKIGTLNTELTTLKATMDTCYSEYKNDTTGDTLGTKLAAYNEAKLKYDEKNFELLSAKAKVNLKDPYGDYKDDDGLKAIIDDYTTKFTALQTKYTALKAGDPKDTAAYALLKQDYEDAKTALATSTVNLEKAQTFLSGTETDSLQGILNTKELNVADKDSKLAAAQEAFKSAESTYKTAQEANSKSQGTSTSDTDGVAEFSNYKIQQDGTIVGTTSDNATVVIGKIALGSVPNTGGLEKDSGYYYTIGASAGNVSVYEAGGSQGRILGNYLEMAKVDLSTEMTDMITTQRGFQANSKIITVTDQMLEELVNLKR